MKLFQFLEQKVKSFFAESQIFFLLLVNFSKCDKLYGL